MQKKVTYKALLRFYYKVNISFIAAAKAENRYVIKLMKTKWFIVILKILSLTFFKAIWNTEICSLCVCVITGVQSANKK